MSMNLWYDLAARELPDLEMALIEKLTPTDSVEPGEPEVELGEPTAVDFF